MDIGRNLYPLWAIVEFLANGIRGFSARFKSRGIIGFTELLEDAFRGTDFDVDDYIKQTRVVQKEIKTKLSKGFRVDFGDNFISLWPNPVGVVRDRIDPSTGQTVPANPDDLRSDDIKTKVSITVAKKFTKDLSKMMEWRKASGTIKDDTEDDEDDATVDPNEHPENITPINTSTGTVDTSTGSGSDNGGSDLPPGNG